MVKKYRELKNQFKNEKRITTIKEMGSSERVILCVIINIVVRYAVNPNPTKPLFLPNANRKRNPIKITSLPDRA